MLCRALMTASGVAPNPDRPNAADEACEAKPASRPADILPPLHPNEFRAERTDSGTAPAPLPPATEEVRDGATTGRPDPAPGPFAVRVPMEEPPLAIRPKAGELPLTVRAEEEEPKDGMLFRTCVETGERKTGRFATCVDGPLRKKDLAGVVEARLGRTFAGPAVGGAPDRGPASCRPLRNAVRLPRETGDPRLPAAKPVALTTLPPPTRAFVGVHVCPPQPLWLVPNAPWPWPPPHVYPP